jgi:nitrous oxide reductase
MLILLAGGDATAALREGSTAAGSGPGASDAASPERTEPSRPEPVPRDELDAEWRLWCGGHEDEGRPRGWPALGAS